VRVYTTMPAEERFWAKVNKTDGCWLWTGAVMSKGYGTLRMGKTTQLAHRVSWSVHRGLIHDELCVLHHCDVPLCVNPQHLFLGTREDNNKDRNMKGRSATGDRNGSRKHPESRPHLRGESCGGAKLTWPLIRQVRALYATGRYSHRRLGVLMGVAHCSIGRIIRQKTWQEQ
jgi:hypothetical protein